MGEQKREKSEVLKLGSQLTLRHSPWKQQVAGAGIKFWLFSENRADRTC